MLQTPQVLAIAAETRYMSVPYCTAACLSVCLYRRLECRATPPLGATGRVILGDKHWKQYMGV